MTVMTTNAAMRGRRAELLVELFFSQMGSQFVAKADGEKLGYDFFIGFRNRRGGTNFAVVEVKATDHLIEGRYPVDAGRFEFLSNCNVPALFLVVDVKNNELYWAWVKKDVLFNRPRRGNVSMRLKKMDTASRLELGQFLESDL